MPPSVALIATEGGILVCTQIIFDVNFLNWSPLMRGNNAIIRVETRHALSLLHPNLFS